MHQNSTRFKFVICALALTFSGASLAQASATDAPASEPAAATQKKMPKKPFKPKSEKGKACSLKADEQNLRGKARQKFRSQCMKAA
jgi:psiF repeat